MAFHSPPGAVAFLSMQPWHVEPNPFVGLLILASMGACDRGGSSSNATPTPAASTSAEGSSAKTKAKLSAAERWGRTDVVEVADSEDGFDAAFWSLFDDLSADKANEAVERLKKERPATWQSSEGDARKQAKTEREAERDKVLRTVYAHTRDADVPQYDQKKEAFIVELGGVTKAAPYWHFSFGTPPIEDKEVGEWKGGRPQRWPILVPPGEADEFAKREHPKWGHALRLDILFQVKRGLPRIGAGGRALVTNVIAWKISSKTTGNVLASLDDEGSKQK